MSSGVNNRSPGSSTSQNSLCGHFHNTSVQQSNSVINSGSLRNSANSSGKGSGTPLSSFSQRRGLQCQPQPRSQSQSPPPPVQLCSPLARRTVTPTEHFRNQAAFMQSQFPCSSQPNARKSPVSSPQSIPTGSQQPNVMISAQYRSSTSPTAKPLPAQCNRTSPQQSITQHHNVSPPGALKPLSLSQPPNQPPKTPQSQLPLPHSGTVQKPVVQPSNSQPSHSSSVQKLTTLVPIVIEFSLMSAKTFGTGCNPQGTPAAIFQTISGSFYDSASKWWSFPLASYRALLSNLETLSSSVTIKRIPTTVLNAIRTVETTPEVTVDMSVFPGKMRNALFPFQRLGISFGIQHKGRCLIADDMGLGKTIQAMGIAAYYKIDWPLLVIAPSSLRLQWATMFEDWLGVGGDDINVIMTGKTSVETGQIVIMSYDLVCKLLPMLQKRNFKIVIADESHFLKNRVAKRTRSVTQLLKQARHAILLSGTPALSRPQELYTQIDAIDPRMFPNFMEFGLRYCGGQRTRFGWNFDGATNLQELNVLLGTCMIRRLKQEVLTELPEKRRERIYIGIVESHVEIIHQIFSDLRHARKGDTAEDEQSSRSEAKRLLYELYRNSGAAKLPLVTDFITDKLEGCSEKFLVFAHHQDVLDGLSNCLKTKGVSFIRIDGKTPAQQRHGLVQVFQEDSSCRVALLSITACGVGLSLTAASQAIFAELFWNPGALRQAEDRIHRIGQRNAVTIQYLIARNTVDEMIWELIERKLDVVGQALDGHTDSLGTADFEGKQGKDAEEVVTQFLHDIMEVVDTYAERMANYRETKSRTRRRKSGNSESQGDDEATEETTSPPVKRPSARPIPIDDGTLDDREEEIDIPVFHMETATKNAQNQMEGFRYNKKPRTSE
ncbi:chromatin-remodeling complex ATPase chain [Pelomyxa schiedti]|nr:chromatin-remodeling complex ATPase chain [Pelomyxa schiedti]